MHLARQQVDVVLDHVEARGRRRQPGDPVHPDHPAAPRRRRQGIDKPVRAAVLRLGALARLARAHRDVVGDVDVLAHPQGQRPGLGKVPPERAVVVTRGAPARAAAGGDAEPVCLTLDVAIGEATTDQKRPSNGRARATNKGRSLPADERT